MIPMSHPHVDEHRNRIITRRPGKGTKCNFKMKLGTIERNTSKTISHETRHDTMMWSATTASLKVSPVHWQCKLLFQSYNIRATCGPIKPSGHWNRAAIVLTHDPSVSVRSYAMTCPAVYRNKTNSQFMKFSTHGTNPLAVLCTTTALPVVQCILQISM